MVTPIYALFGHGFIVSAEAFLHYDQRAIHGWSKSRAQGVNARSPYQQTNFKHSSSTQFPAARSDRQAISCPAQAISRLSTTPIRYRRWGNSPIACYAAKLESHPTAPGPARSKESFPSSFGFSLLPAAVATHETGSFTAGL
jgi:hypothetical protein